MTGSEKKALKSCSKKDLIKLINDPRYTQNKAMQFPAIVGYLARHGLPGGSTKDDLMDMIYSARNELIAQAAQKHMNTKQPFAYDDLGGLKGAGDIRVKNFIKNPVKAIADEMKSFYERQENFDGMDPDEVQYYQSLKVNANTLAIELGIRQDSIRFEGQADRIDITSRLSKKMPEKDANLGASLKRVNSGFFGTLFRRPSKEFAAFQESFNIFRDSSKAISGNVADLEAKTTAYLKHVIPNFKYSKDMPRDQWLAALPKGKRARAGFCMDVLDSVAEHKEAKPYMDNVEKAVNGKPIDKSLDQPPVKEEIKQEDFQKEVQKAIEPPAPKKEEVVADEKEPQIQQSDLEP